MPRVHPSRSAITVAGIVGHTRSNSRIRGSTASTTDPAGRRTYLGGPSLANADFTVFLLTLSTRAIPLIDMPSARCSRRISAQSSTDNTHFLLARLAARLKRGVKIRAATRGQFSGVADSQA